MNDFLHSFFDPHEMAQALPSLLTEGLPNTLLIAVLAIAVGLVVGALLAVSLISRSRWARLPARLYVDVFRGLPAIVTVSLIGLGLPSAGLNLFGRSPVGYAVLAVGLINAAYIAEILRSGIQSVPNGQVEAGRSLGLSHLATLTLVVAPQAFRNILPALANQFIVSVKESSLVYLLGLAVGQRELYFIAQQQQATTYNSSALVLAGLFYVAITIPLTYFVNWLHRRLGDESVRREPVLAEFTGLPEGSVA